MHVRCEEKRKLENIIFHRANAIYSPHVRHIVRCALYNMKKKKKKEIYQRHFNAISGHLEIKLNRKIRTLRKKNRFSNVKRAENGKLLFLQSIYIRTRTRTRTWTQTWMWTCRYYNECKRKHTSFLILFSSITSASSNQMKVLFSAFYFKSGTKWSLVITEKQNFLSIFDRNVNLIEWK